MMDKQARNLYSTTFTVSLAVVVFTLLLAVSFDNQHTWDVTANKRFTFSEQTEQVVKSLDVPVKLYAFLDPNGNTKMIEDTLTRYRALNARYFSFQIVDKDKEPTLAAALEVRNHGQGILELEDLDLEKKDVARRERVNTFDEAGITNALVRLRRTGVRKIYFRELANSPYPMGQSFKELAKGLTLEGYEAQFVDLIKAEAIPFDCEILVLAGPHTALGNKEQALIDAFLERGGKLLFLADVLTPSQYSDWLKGYGFELRAQLILDRASQMLNTDDMSFSVGFCELSNHPIAVASKVQTALQLARPVGKLEETTWPGGKPTLEVVSQTAATAVAKEYDPNDRETLQASVVYSQNEAKDSLPLAVAGVFPSAGEDTPQPLPSPGEQDGSEPKKGKSARIVVIGNTVAFTDGFLDKAGNRDFILNVLNWLGESEDQITVRVKDQKNQPMMLQKNQFSWLLFIFCVLLPVLCTITGLMVAYQRRKGLTE